MLGASRGRRLENRHRRTRSAPGCRLWRLFGPDLGGCAVTEPVAERIPGPVTLAVTEPDAQPDPAVAVLGALRHPPGRDALPGDRVEPERHRRAQARH